MTFSHWLVDEKRGLCIKLKVNDDIWYAKPIYLYLYQKDIAILMMVGFSIFVGGLSTTVVQFQAVGTRASSLVMFIGVDFQMIIIVE